MDSLLADDRMNPSRTNFGKTTASFSPSTRPETPDRVLRVACQWTRNRTFGGYAPSYETRGKLALVSGDNEHLVRCISPNPLKVRSRSQITVPRRVQETSS